MTNEGETAKLGQMFPISTFRLSSDTGQMFLLSTFRLSTFQISDLMVEGETATLGQMLASIKRPTPQARSRRRCAVQCVPSACGTYTGLVVQIYTRLVVQMCQD